MKVTLGNYVPLDSLVHRLDPRAKLFLMGLGIGAAFQLDTAGGLALFLLMCTAVTVSARIPGRMLLSGLIPFLWLFGFTAVLHLFMTAGDPIAWLPHATWQGLTGGLRVGTQLVFAIWLSTLTTLTTSPLNLVWALEWFMKPLKYLKVPTEDIALLVMLAIRFIPTLFEETERIIKAQKARGVDLESGGLIARVRALVPVLVPLLHGVFRRADDLAIALTLRGYAPGIVRTRMKELRACPSDLVSVCLGSLVLVSMMWL
ncbi:MAG TPA: energy-coupling factor transporter transmembrane protein EcfT [Deltaproteobacteria bacterium]|nr:energy-coupling factor transporter transmembrane protein EcfT [Deltaproteobacteria bacterium]